MSDTERMLKWFRSGHLPPQLQPMAKEFGRFAEAICEAVPPSAERTAGLRKLVEAKDCVIRCLVEKTEGEAEAEIGSVVAGKGV